MLSQLSSATSKITPFTYSRSPEPKTPVWTKVAALGVALLFAFFVVHGVHGLTQAFGIA
jgi:hypothetical protein